MNNKKWIGVDEKFMEHLDEDIYCSDADYDDQAYYEIIEIKNFENSAI